MLVVEDIIDSGLTLSYLMRNLEARKPASLEICALLTKPERREIDVPVRYVGFEIPNKFVIGYGLDFAERYRNLPLRRRAPPGPDAAALSGVHGTSPCRGGSSAQAGCYPPRDPRESLLPQRALPPDRDRAARLPGEPDADPAAARTQQKLTYSQLTRTGRARATSRTSSSTRASAQITATLVGGDKVKVNYPSDQSQLEFEKQLADRERHLRLEGHGRLLVGLAADLAAAVRAPDRLLDLPDEPGAGRRLEGDELRQVAREADDARLAEDRLQGRRRRGRGGRGAARDQGVPREPEEVPGARRADPEGRAALRAARHRQDAARARRRRRGGRAVLLDLRLGLRRDVRRRRRLARARPLRAGEAGEPLHHLHGRDRRRRPPSRRRPRRRPRRARADAEPAARRDGRLRDEGQHHPHRRHEPARHPRPGAAAPRPLRPADRRRPARPERPPEDPRGALEGQAARVARSTSTRSPPARPASPAPTSRTSSTRPRCSPRAAARRRSSRTSSRKGSCA